MPLTSSDLIAPKGEIEKALFPGEDAPQLMLRLQGYLDEAYAKLATLNLPSEVDHDESAKAYAYYRAYKAVHIRMSATAATATIQGEASRSFLASQIASFAELRDDNLQTWNDVLALAQETIIDQRSIDVQSGPQQVIPTW